MSNVQEKGNTPPTETKCASNDPLKLCCLYGKGPQLVKAMRMMGLCIVRHVQMYQYIRLSSHAEEIDGSESLKHLKT